MARKQKIPTGIAQSKVGSWLDKTFQLDEIEKKNTFFSKYDEKMIEFYPPPW